MEKFPLKYGCTNRTPKGKEYALVFKPKDTLLPQNVDRKVWGLAMGGGVERGKNWDNCNSINNKIFKKK